MHKLFLLVGSIFFLSCTAGDNKQDHSIYWVNSSKVSCAGMAPSKCLQIQKSETLDPAVWEAKRIKDMPLLTGVDNSSPPQLGILVGEMRYSGSDGCNNFTGGIIELDKHKIRFGIAAGTRMMCSDMKIPDLFNKILPEVNSWEISDSILHLFDADGREVMQLSKQD